MDKDSSSPASGNGDDVLALEGTVQVTAFAIARSLDLKQVSQTLGDTRVRLARKHLSARYSSGKITYCFDFGAVVFVGWDESEEQELLAKILSSVPEEERETRYEEDYRIVIDPNIGKRTRVDFDEVVVSSLTRSTAEIIARLLAQSAAVERYEVELARTLAELDEVTQRMKRTGRIQARRSKVMQLIARSTATKNRIVGKLSLLDKPNLTWESERSDILYSQLRNMLELQDRFETLEYKQRAIHETVTLILSVMQDKRAVVLEATIVVLIAIEIGLALLHVA
jgi:uncharacterized Rmd1/YagE family protein